LTSTSANSRRIGGKKALAVAALLQSDSIAAAAETLGVSTRSLQRWRKDPAFAAALLEQQTEIFLTVSNACRALAMDATKTLGTILRDVTAPAPSRVRASMAILALLTRVHDREVVEARIRKLEAAKRRTDHARQHR
jgi:hypothetical protein